MVRDGKHKDYYNQVKYCRRLVLFKLSFIGTFQAETDEEIAYGLVHPLASWDPMWTQVRLRVIVKAEGPPPLPR